MYARGWPSFEETSMSVWDEFRRRYPGKRTEWVEEAALRASYPAAGDELIAVLRALGVGELGVDANRVFTLDEADERRASVLEQLAREREEVVELGGSQCSGQGHETAEDCLDALTKLEHVVAGLYALMGPDDVHDFVYVVVGGEWHGRVGVWYHDYPICELFEDPPKHPDLAAFGAHLLQIAGDEDARLL
jgi:hypothetical protein